MADNRAIRVTREELYKQVWETPMSRLAQQYGVSGPGLAEACDRLRVPHPPRGYWTKKAAGKEVTHYRLPEWGSDKPDSVEIGPTPVRFSARNLPPEIQRQIDDFAARLGRIVVPEQLSRPHPINAARLPCQAQAEGGGRPDRNRLAPASHPRHAGQGGLAARHKGHGVRIRF